MAQKSYKLKDVESRFNDAVNTQADHRGEILRHLDYYVNSVFYQPKKGEKFSRNQVPVNLMATFADKNIHFSSAFPEIKVLTNSGDPASRTKADLAEKLIDSVLEKSLGKSMQRKLSQDGTLKSMAVLVTSFDFTKREVNVKRYDPRNVFFTRSNRNSDQISELFIAYPVTVAEIREKYGIEGDIKEGAVEPFTYDESGDVNHLDNQDWRMMVIFMDDEVRGAFVGDRWIEKPHKHLMGALPADIAIPLPDPREPLRGDFFIRTLVPLQAEINNAFKMRAGIVRKMGAPAIYARGLYSRQLEEVLRALQGDGGLIGLKGQGELGVLAPPETKMIDNHIADLITQMMRIAGFGSASFGEATGANTSGDAYGMLFSPTTRSMDYQNIAWVALYQSVASKILYCYTRFYQDNEPIRLTGYRPLATLMGNADDNAKTMPVFQQVNDELVFTKEALMGVRNILVTMPSVTPVDKNAMDRLTYEMATTGFISRTTGYERIGIKSPEDELRLLQEENMNPAVNPEGASKLISSMGGGQNVQQPVQ